MPALPLFRTFRALLALLIATGVVAGAAHAQTVLPFVFQDAASDTLLSVGPDGTFTPHLGLRYADGTLQTTAAAAGWQLSGNEGTAPGTHFLGTSDNAPFEVHVNGQRAMRFEPGSVPNVIGGYFGNFVNTGVVGATISGGGTAAFVNRATAHYGSIGGGISNWVSGGSATIGGGNANSASALNAIVGGGHNNISSGLSSTVGGGSTNTASGVESTVGGGLRNSASGDGAAVAGGRTNNASESFATVAGGHQNTANGLNTTVSGGHLNSATGNTSSVGGGDRNMAGGNFATVPGGASNSAAGVGSFAAGFRAKANHNGTFVWADGQNADFTSANINTFNVRAANGVNIHHGLLFASNAWPIRIHNPNTSFVAGMRISNDGFFDVTNQAPFPTAYARLSSAGTWTAVSDRRLKTDISPATGVLAGVMQLQPTRFRYRDDTSGAVHLGLIAQEVQAVFPEYVTEGEILTLDYAGLSAVALGAIREQQDRIEQQQAQIEALQVQLTALAQPRQPVAAGLGAVPWLLALAGFGLAGLVLRQRGGSRAGRARSDRA